TSPTAARALARAGLGGAAGPFLIPGAVDTDAFCPDTDGRPFRREMGFEADDVVVGLVARWKKGRGLLEFLQAFALAAERERALCALFIGRGELEPVLRAEAARLGLEGRARLVSPGARFPEALAACDLGALMRPGSDGSARAALELMATARAVVLWKYGSLVDLEGEEGAPRAVLCSSEDELAQALRHLAASPDERARIGQAARAWVEARHSMPRVRETLSAFALRAVKEADASRLR
ncbi:MAG: glycosyltransferase, partial [Planctomycetota bacterium]